jgi:hypothetical protein
MLNGQKCWSGDGSGILAARDERLGYESYRAVLKELGEHRRSLEISLYRADTV